MAHPSADPERHTPLTGDIHNPIDTYLPEITTPKPTTPRDSYLGKWAVCAHFGAHVGGMSCAGDSLPIDFTPPTPGHPWVRDMRGVYGPELCRAMLSIAGLPSSDVARAVGLQLPELSDSYMVRDQLGQVLTEVVEASGVLCCRIPLTSTLA